MVLDLESDRSTNRRMLVVDAILWLLTAPLAFGHLNFLVVLVGCVYSYRRMYYDSLVPLVGLVVLCTAAG